MHIAGAQAAGQAGQGQAGTDGAGASWHCCATGRCCRPLQRLASQRCPWRPAAAAGAGGGSGGEAGRGCGGGRGAEPLCRHQRHHGLGLLPLGNHALDPAQVGFVLRLAAGAGCAPAVAAALVQPLLLAFPPLPASPAAFGCGCSFCPAFDCVAVVCSSILPASPPPRPCVSRSQMEGKSAKQKDNKDKNWDLQVRAG